MRLDIKSKAEDISSEDYISESSSSSHRLDLNDLLKRNKLAEKEDRKTNLLIISLVVFLAAVVILILSFS